MFPDSFEPIAFGKALNGTLTALKIVSAEAAIAIIQDSDVLATTGYGGHGVPENLTLVHSTGQGDAGQLGLSRLAHPGLIRRIIGGYYGLSPKLTDMALNEEMEA